MEKTQRNNIMLAFFTLLAVIVIVSIIGFFTLGKGPEIIQGQAEATEYRVSSKVPGRILKFFVSEGDKVKAGDTLAILEAPDVMAKLSQAQAAEQAAQALNEKALRGTRSEQLQAAYEMWQARTRLSAGGTVRRAGQRASSAATMFFWISSMSPTPSMATSWPRDL